MAEEHARNAGMADASAGVQEEGGELLDAYAGRMLRLGEGSVSQSSHSIVHRDFAAQAGVREVCRPGYGRLQGPVSGMQQPDTFFWSQEDYADRVASVSREVEPSLRADARSIAVVDQVSHFSEAGSSILAEQRDPQLEGAVAAEFCPIVQEIEQLLRGESADANFAVKDYGSSSQEISRLCRVFSTGFPFALGSLPQKVGQGSTRSQQLLGILLGLVAVVLQQIVSLLPDVWSGRKRKRRDSLAQQLLLHVDDESGRFCDDEDDEYSRLLPLVCMYHANLNSLLLAVTRGEEVEAAPRGMDWFHKYQLGIFDDESWIRNLRMTTDTFSSIVEALRPHCTKQMTNFKMPICVELKVAACIYKLVNGSTLARTAEAFNIGKATVYDIMREIIPAIVKVFGQRFTWPCGSYMHEIMESIHRRTGLPNCVGAIGSCHISILQSCRGKQDRKNRKLNISYTVQGVCDHKLKFTNVFVGMPGYGHDTKVLRSSVLWKSANNHCIFNDSSDTFPSGVLLPSYVLGDNSFPNLQWLITPFKHYGRRPLTEQEKDFNHRVNLGRSLIEQAFALLKRNFQELARPSRLAAGYLPKVITACMCLHNILLDSNSLDVEEIVRQTEQEPGRSHIQHYYVIDQARPRTLHVDEVSGDVLRDGLAEYIQFQGRT